MNLYEEIVEDLRCENKTIKDIHWVSIEEKEIDLENFLDVAKNTNYDRGYGCAEIPMSLIICGNNWWLERHEYDGKEWFEYKEQPTPPYDTQSKIYKIKY